MKNIQEQQAHESHSHDHSHDHDHGKMPIISYFIGLVLAIIGLLSDANLLIKHLIFNCHNHSRLPCNYSRRNWRDS